MFCCFKRKYHNLLESLSAFFIPYEFRIASFTFYSVARKPTGYPPPSGKEPPLFLGTPSVKIEKIFEFSSFFFQVANVFLVVKFMTSEVYAIYKWVFDRAPFNFLLETLFAGMITSQ